MKLLKKFIISLVLITLGYFIHKVIIEVANFHAAQRYNKCLRNFNFIIPMPDLLYVCSPVLSYSKIERILLYQPNFYCEESKVLCENKN